MWLTRLDRNMLKQKLTTEDMNTAVVGSVRDLGYSRLNENQMLVIVNFLNGNHVFVALGTDHDKNCVTFAFQEM